MNKVNLEIVILQQQQPHENIQKQNPMPLRLPHKH